MAHRVEVQLDGRLAEIRVVPAAGAHAPAPPGEGQAPRHPAGVSEQRLDQMQARMDAELADLRSARLALGAAAEKIQQLQEQLLREAEGQLVELAVEVSRKVLMQEIEAGRYKVEPIVQEVLRDVPGGMSATVHLNSADLARCEMAGQEEEAGPSAIRFVGDPNVRPAECLVQTEGGMLGSSVEGHLAEIAHALKSQE